GVGGGAGDGGMGGVGVDIGKLPMAGAMALTAAAVATSARLSATSSLRAAANAIVVGKSNGPPGAGAAAIATAINGIIAPGKTGRLTPRSIYLGERANSKYVLENRTPMSALETYNIYSPTFALVPL